jgi:hypothetical protein
VKHVEFWIPVWERKAGTFQNTYIPAPAPRFPRTFLQTIVNATTQSFEALDSVSTVYQQSTGKATLERVFKFVQSTFDEATVLTLEGGHCKKPPMVNYLEDTVNNDTLWRPLPGLEKIGVLVLKGSWNIMRDHVHFAHLMHSFPRLRELHTNYSKAKKGPYKSKFRTSLS